MRMLKMAVTYTSAAAMGLIAGLSGISQANAYTDVVSATCQASRVNPTMTFNKGAAPYGTLYTYYSEKAYCGSQLLAVRRKVTMKAGSGNGTKNECKSFAGWLPNGTYNARYEVNHQTSSPVVKGSVWALSNKTCSTSAPGASGPVVTRDGPVHPLEWRQWWFMGGDQLQVTGLHQDQPDEPLLSRGPLQPADLRNVQHHPQGHQLTVPLHRRHRVDPSLSFPVK